MGKMTAALIMIASIELGVALFMQDTAISSLLFWVTHPQEASYTDFLGSATSILFNLAASTAIIAGFLYAVRPEAVYASVALFVISFITIIARWWTLIASQGVFGQSGWLVATLLITPLSIFFLITVLDYARTPG